MVASDVKTNQHSMAHALPLDQLIAELGTDVVQGLADNQAASRLENGGSNELAEQSPVPAWKKFLAQFRELVIWILIAAAIISGALDRRTSARVPFGSVLGVIEHNGTLPDSSEFRPVKAVDLSQTGIAFSTTRWPSSDWVVVMLGEQDNPRYATARVVGCLSKSADPYEKRFEVRCEFEQ